MKADRLRLIFVIALVTLALVAIFWVDGGVEYNSFADRLLGNIKLGLDIKGGSRLDYAIKVEEGVEKSIDEVANEVVTVVRQRLDNANYTEAVAVRIGSGENSRLRVEIPGIDDPAAAERLVGKKGKLYFGEILDMQSSDVQPAKKIGMNYIDAVWLKQRDRGNGDTNIWYLVRPYSKIGAQKYYLDGSSVKDAKAVADTQRGGFSISLTFDGTGADTFAKITSNFLGKQVPIVLDDIVLVAPVVEVAIRDGRASITGRYTAQEAMETAALIKSGNLPAELIKLEERTLGPTLGKDIINSSLFAGMVGLIIVLIYMLVYYGVFGIVADIALIYNSIVLFGAMAAGNFILTLPGIAGIILTIGTTVDGNIIVFERIKEEMRLGKTALNAIASGYKRSITTIMDANITTILAGVVLYYLGTGTIRGFATTLIIGILGSMFTTLVVSRVFIDAFSGAIKVKPLKIEGDAK